MMNKIEIKFLNDTYGTDGIYRINGEKSNWIDLRAAEDVKLNKGDFYMIHLGVAMKLPDGYEAHLAPRSSTFKNFGILQCNSVGVIDSSYCGENDWWKMPVYATRDTEIHKGDRIAQFRIMTTQPEIEFIESTLANYENRGGFGSSGVQ